jgi:hypothetical protein
MTCIVGFIDKKEKKVYVGADSAGVGGLDIRERKDVKVFKVGEFVIGCTSSFRMIQLIRFSFNPPKIYPDTDIYRYMCTDFVDALRQCFKNGGFAKSVNGEESGGTFLVGYKDRLFEIEDDYQVAEHYNDFSSVGCGFKYALGALAAMDINLSTEAKVNRSLEIATQFSAGVRPPFIIETT